MKSITVSSRDECEIQIHNAVKNVKTKLQTIEVDTKAGKKVSAKANVIGDYAFHKPIGPLRTGYTITHIPSGKRAWGRIKRRKDAKEIAYRLSLIDEKFDGVGEPSQDLYDAVLRVGREFSERTAI